MFKPFRKVAVLGAGVMGSQIAAHLANAGLKVYLLDLAAEGNNKNQIVEGAFKKAIKQTPPILFSEKVSQRIILGNFADDFHQLNSVDWVIEAVIENLEIKQKLFKSITNIVGENTIISSNTSGLLLHQIAADLPESIRQRFLGTHFFNPPRYLKLLELIPLEITDLDIVKRLQWFGRLHLGKGMIVAKDTPGFVANRIGTYVTLLTFHAWLEQNYTIEEVDLLTGCLIGRPKSATFRTIDVVGLDVLSHVAEHLYHALPDDLDREVLQVPDVVKKLVKSGALGAKVGHGFYKKEHQEILSINPKTLIYEPAKPVKLDNIEEISRLKDLGDRIHALYQNSGRAGHLFRYLTLRTLNYCAHRIPEITDNPADLDRAMRWGFGWDVGPFELWDLLGFVPMIEDMEKQGLMIPNWIESLKDSQVKRFYHQELSLNGNDLLTHEPCLGESCFTSGMVYSHNGRILLGNPQDEIRLSAVKTNPNNLLWYNSESALLDLGDGVVLFEFLSKGNTLTLKTVEGLLTVLDLLPVQPWRGMIIGNDQGNFSAGANLMEMGIMAQCGELEKIAQFLDQVQMMMQRLRYSPKPIVAAVQGLAVGGGCELIMACPQVVATAESYIGLVELSVGLIPGAGGLMTMAAYASEKAATNSASDLHPFLKKVFETVGMATVSHSATEAMELGFLPCHTRLVMNGSRHLFVAKELVLYLDKEGYLPPPERHIFVAGRPGRAMLEMIAYNMLQGGWISEYDQFLANRLAYVLTGGDLDAPTYVTETYLLQLEKEMFLPLLQQPKTQERVAYMLKTKKPLRN
jgi:3-hydroxyacyl-CoA dehydrogenase